MGRRYHLDPGYVTIPEAANIVKRMLGITNEEDHAHYKKILRGAKRSWFGGKMHGKRMFQVRRVDIIKYGEELLEAEKFNLFTFDIVAGQYKELHQNV
ncbi:MAG: hypothetical protein ACQEXB_25525 [Bacillota bacterium]